MPNITRRTLKYVGVSRRNTFKVAGEFTSDELTELANGVTAIPAALTKAFEDWKTKHKLSEIENELFRIAPEAQDNFDTVEELLKKNTEVFGALERALHKASGKLEDYEIGNMVDDGSYSSY